MAGVAAAGTGLAACGQLTSPGSEPRPPRFAWTMVTSWPSHFPILGEAARRLARRIEETSGGRITLRVFGSGELVPPFEVFDAVSRGVAQIGHSAASFWKAKLPAAPFFCAVPFGLNAREMSGWLHSGGGLALWRELYAPYHLLPLPVGNTGMQLAGWFHEPISSVADLRGLRMRLPGLGGEVLAKLGGRPIHLPGAELLAAMQDGRLDAAEWMGPHNDLAFGLHRVARHAHVPGWQEPGMLVEAILHRPAWDALPADLQAIVESCCAEAHEQVLAESTTRNLEALDPLVREHGIDIRRLPDDVLAALRRAADAVLEEHTAADPFARRVYDSMRSYRAKAQAWHSVSEQAFYQARR